MSLTDRSIDTVPALELRVLQGPLKGARCTLQAHRPTSVGAGPDHDIVLPEQALGGGRVCLHAASGVVQVRVLSGPVSIDGLPLAPGSHRKLVLHHPLQLGEATVAIAPVEAPWADCLQSASATSACHPATPRAIASWRRCALLPVGVALCAVSALGLMVGDAPDARRVGASPPARQIEADLHAAGYSQLRVHALPGAGLRVTGHLDTADQRAEVVRLLVRTGAAARLEVGVQAHLMAAVREVFRAHHVAAQVEAVGPGRLQVRAAGLDASALNRIAAQVWQDVPGLQALDVQSTETGDSAPVRAAALPEPVDPGKRIASIVPGEAAYVVTADGTRYFQGAVLPGGERLVAIAGGDVRLEVAAAGPAAWRRPSSQTF